jgi:serine/threonine protein phosphatase 1
MHCLQQPFTGVGRHCIAPRQWRQSNGVQLKRIRVPSRVVAIGDVHGCATALRAIVQAIGLQSDDTLVMLGDCVDRGPESRQVIDEVLKLRGCCHLVPLLGNHEEMMLNFLDGKPQPDNWLEVGGAATVRSYSEKSEPEEIAPEHVEFIRSWGDCYETSSHFFVHGNYEPERRLAGQHWQTMRWQSLKNRMPGPHVSGKTAIVGHTSLKDGDVLDLGHLICIDTYCWGGGWLTAFDTTSGEIWQFDREGKQRRKVPTPRRVPPWTI